MVRKMVNLEMHVAHSCNLTCESCSHFSNHKHKGVVSLETANEWMMLWRDRLFPNHFSLLGGEPTIHPRFPEFVRLAREHWPRSYIRIVTNGFFLHRHPDLPRVISEVGGAVLQVSIHHISPQYLKALEPNLRLLKEWIQNYDIAVSFTSSVRSWTRRYKGHGDEMEPFEDGDPRESWKNCHARYCRQLFEGKIWKCPPLAYLPVQRDIHRLSEKWDPYLAYEPLSPDCTDDQLNEFLDRNEEPYCAMCPAAPERLDKPLPLSAGKRLPDVQGPDTLDPFVQFVAFDHRAVSSIEVTKTARNLKRHVDVPVIEAISGTVRGKRPAR